MRHRKNNCHYRQGKRTRKPVVACQPTSDNEDDGAVLNDEEFSSKIDCQSYPNSLLCELESV